MKLRELLKERNVNQRSVAAACGISPAALSHYVKGEREPDHETLIKLADYFNVSVDYLLGREENYQNGNSLATSNTFVQEYNHLFNDIYFNRYTKIYSLLNQEQRVYIVGVVYGAVEQFGISYADIG